MRKSMKVIGFIFSMCFVCSVYAQTLNKGRVRILYSPGKPSNTFIPSAIIGAAFDGHEKGDIKSMLSPENIAAMHSVGFKPIAYRLRTELSGEVWHWNPAGTWSESITACAPPATYSLHPASSAWQLLPRLRGIHSFLDAYPRRYAHKVPG